MLYEVITIDNLFYNIIMIFSVISLSMALFSFLHRRYMAAGFVAMLLGLYAFFYLMLFHYGIILNILFRITSYNVCYTKLLRDLLRFSPESPLALNASYTISLTQKVSDRNNFV